jgi:hypothetical protein
MTKAKESLNKTNVEEEPKHRRGGVGEKDDDKDAQELRPKDVWTDHKRWTAFGRWLESDCSSMRCSTA